MVDICFANITVRNEKGATHIRAEMHYAELSDGVLKLPHFRWRR